MARGGQRLARQGQPTYERLIQVLRESAVVNADETSWKIGGEKAWLWVFTNQEVSVYTIDPTRAHEVAERVLGRSSTASWDATASQPTIRWPIGNRSAWAIC